MNRDAQELSDFVRALIADAEDEPGAKNSPGLSVAALLFKGELQRLGLWRDPESPA